MVTARGSCRVCLPCFSLFTNKVNLFAGVEITFAIKDGECKRVCCDGAGGPVYMVSSCKPQSSSCEGFKSEEKQEEDHCPGEAKDLCTSTCGPLAGDRGESF